MSTLIRKQPWEVHGVTVRGASHERTGLPNQDTWTWEATSSKGGTSLVLAVADGHGNAKSFRSDMGAKFAVKVATETLREFADAFASQGNLGVVERAMESDLPQEIVKRWQEMVNEHCTGNPFTETELGVITPDDRKLVGETSLVAYGATLVAVLLTDRFIGYLQLGDGDILVVSEKGEVSRPLPPDERLMANETTSLCSVGSSGGKRRPAAGPTGAWVDFRIKLAHTTTTPPVLILVSTDGYANSFRSDADFLRVGSDLCEIVRSKGLEYIKANLENWLAEASKAGSGDDVTVGLLCRMDAMGDKPQGTPSASQSSPKPSSPYKVVISAVAIVVGLTAIGVASAAAWMICCP
jgi:serine/threonine protein phosphatase PrpC